MKIKRYTLYILSGVLLIVMILYAKDTILAAKSALELCIVTVIPTLFPFFVLSSFMVNTGFVNCIGLFLSPVAKRVFKISGSGAVAFFMGVLCGYPTGAKMVTSLYEKKAISQNEAYRLLPFCNNAGPLFVIGAVGTGFLQSTELGVMLYVVHVLSGVLTGIVCSFFAKSTIETRPKPVLAIRAGRAFSDAVKESVITMLTVCGFIVCFSVLRSIILPLLFLLFGKGALTYTLAGLLEVTFGAFEICQFSLPIRDVLIILSALIGFGGVCVVFQVNGIISESGLSIKTYLPGKLLQMVLSVFLMWLFSNEMQEQTVFLNAGSLTKKYIPVLPYILFSVIFLYAYLWTAKKNEKF